MIHTFVVSLVCLAPQSAVAPPHALGDRTAPAHGTTMQFIGAASVPGDALDTSGLTGEVMPGIPHARLGSMGSGVDALPSVNGEFRLISVCDRGPADGAAAFACRLHEWHLQVDLKAPVPVSVKHQSTQLLRRPSGEPFTGLAAELSQFTLVDGTKLSARLDPECIRRLPSGNLLIGDEYLPAVLEFSTQGDFVRNWPIPQRYRCANPGKDEAAEMPPANTAGRQPNKGFEGLAITPSGEVWVLLQNPLLQDGALNAKNKRIGHNIRMLCLGKEPGAKSPQELIYRLDKPAYAVSELLALDDHRFLAIERDGTEGKFRRIYLIDTTAATDVSGTESLPADALPSSVKAVRKELLIDLADPACGIARTPDKIEGLCLGPLLADGRKTLLVVSDNDMKSDEPTWFWLFAFPAKKE